MVFETHQGGQSGGNLRFSPKKPPVLLFCLKKIQQFQVSPANGKTGEKDVFFLPDFFLGKGARPCPFRQPGLLACELYAQGTDGTIAIHCGGQGSGLWRMGSQDGSTDTWLGSGPSFISHEGKGHLEGIPQPDP